MLSAYAYRTLITQVAIMAACVAFAQQPFELDPSFELSNVNETAVGSILPLLDTAILLSGEMRFPGDIVDRASTIVDITGLRNQSYPYACGGGRLQPWDSLFYVGCGQGVNRLSFTGANDLSFAPNSSPFFAYSQGGAYHVYSDGGVLLGGRHTLSDSIRGFMGPHSMIWLTNTGYLDTTKTHRKAQFPVWTMKEQSDGKFMLSTSGGTYQGFNAGSVLRVHADGERDTTFQGPIFFERAHDIVTLPSGKYLVGGGFKFQQNSPDTLGLVRLNHDGSLDTSFQIPYIETRYRNGTTLSRVYDILDLEDGRIIVTGNFDYVDGQARGGICMLDTNGNLLNDAFVGATVGSWFWGTSMIERRSVWGITQAPDGPFYIYGSYHGYNDGNNNYPGQRMISRLYGLNVGQQQDVSFDNAQDDIIAYPNPGNTQLNIRLPHGERTGTVQFFDAAGRVYLNTVIASRNTQVNTADLPSGLYLVVYTNLQGATWRTRWVKE